MKCPFLDQMISFGRITRKKEKKSGKHMLASLSKSFMKKAGFHTLKTASSPSRTRISTRLSFGQRKRNQENLKRKIEFVSLYFNFLK